MKHLRQSARYVPVVGQVASGTDVALAIKTASVLFVVALTAAAAQVSIPLPFTPVPLTIQPMVVLLGGAVLGWRLGATSQVLYLLAGAVGLPAFAASPELPPGMLRLLGPTGGYLLSFPLAAAATGLLSERGLDRRWAANALSMSIGLIIIYTVGVTRLAFGGPAPLGVSVALSIGLYPFVATDVIKVAIAAGIVPGLWRCLEQKDDASSSSA